MATALWACPELSCASSRTQLPASPQAPSFSNSKSQSQSKSRGFYPSQLPPPSSRSLHSSFLPHPRLLTCRNAPLTEPPQETEAGSGGQQQPPAGNEEEEDGGGGGAIGRLSSAFIFALWAAFIGYCVFLAPNQTPVTDQYFLEKLLNLKGGDGFQINRIMYCLWYSMGLWPVIYWMLLIPSGRSSGNKIPIWPFMSLSFFAGAFALLPYFGLWQPPPPKVSKEELQGWPLKVLDSKVLAIAVAIAGAGLFGAAAIAGGESWTEFRKFFNSSRFIHIMSLDFLALSSLAPFWIFNDMEVRQRSKKGSWAPALAVIPFLGPALYLILRPSLRQVEGE